ncbi:hypothetical protein D7Z26_01165 [Cohnella endophytica]|uniref:Uncharacterized protein n=1 Tax=Cohnella endophytica TaxID=2419778 RepID=A0A494Y767_9BACL|nr:hypothetical protein [Cohnella endophytica]RKP58144.1 hypothetical protein D7Z26_01165 [Cohnella endophytica]
MTGTRTMKLLGLIGGVALLNIVIFSPGFIGVDIGGDSALETASGVTLLLSSVLTLLYGSYALLLKPAVATPVKELKSHEDYIAAFIPYKKLKALNTETGLAIDQLNRMDKKRNVLLKVLSERFNRTELSFQKFIAVIAEVENLFFLNMRGILNKLSVFDLSEFDMLANPQRSKLFSGKLLQERSVLYQEYFAFVKGSLDANEEILLKLDKLLLEISQLGSANYEDVENMPCMKEIDSLIKQTKFYEQ